jgi:tetratricopeptide (TPR) repeat protein
MSANNVLRLGEYRDRRAQRLRLQASLCQTDKGRAALLEHLADLARVTGADRSAVVWVDEYGPGLVHPHVVLDLASDRPRRSFAMEPLRRAWDTGVPGVFCQAEASAPGPGRLPWTMAVALGSDGSRAWFLVADALAPRGRLSGGLRERIMFLAGECSALVLHRDLDLPAEEPSEAGARPGFAGWPILKDIEGREADDEESRLIALRFIVARLPRLLLEDDLTVSLERLREQAERARAEIRGQLQGCESSEEALWEDVLQAFQEADLESLALRMVALGEAAESGGHLHSAAELYRTAFEIAAATGTVDTAVEAARFAGRALRRRASWSEAHHWYGVARGVAEAAGMDARLAVILDGLASTHRARGNLPAARATLNEALPIAARSGDARAVGSVYHGLMTLEHVAGNLDRALRCGWLASTTYDRDDDRVYALATLAGVLVDAGHLDAAEDAWTVVSHMTDNHYYRLYAFDALAYLAALRGDEALFALHAAEADALGWNTGTPSVKAEILLYRGLSYRALGKLDAARSWLEQAVEFADKRGFSQTLFRAEEALGNLHAHAAPVEDPKVEPTTSFEVQAGLKSLREAWAVAAPS